MAGNNAHATASKESEGRPSGNGSGNGGGGIGGGRSSGGVSGVAVHVPGPLGGAVELVRPQWPQAAVAAAVRKATTSRAQGYEPIP